MAEAELKLLSVDAVSTPPAIVVAPAYAFAPLRLVTPDWTLSEAAPPIPFTTPPCEVIAPVSAPLRTAPPESVIALTVWACPPRSSAPPETTVAEDALSALAPTACNAPDEMVVAPV